MLVLVGSGEYLPVVDPIDQTLLKRLGEPARVVCLPTAAGREGDAMINSWMDRGVAHYQRLGAAATGVRVWDRTTAQDPAHAATIRAANFVYLSGGDPGYLANTLEDTPVWDAIVGVHEAGGVVAGCSAGAMIMGEQIRGPGGARAGFNQLPGTIIMPHFNEFPGMISRMVRLFSDKRLALVGIDGHTALVLDGDNAEVMGASQVTLMRKGETKKFGAGPLPAGSLP